MLWRYTDCSPYCLIFTRSRVQASAFTLVIQSEILYRFPPYFEADTGMVPKIAPLTLPYLYSNSLFTGYPLFRLFRSEIQLKIENEANLGQFSTFCRSLGNSCYFHNFYRKFSDGLTLKKARPLDM
jgi:hypothetical protein